MPQPAMPMLPEMNLLRQRLCVNFLGNWSQYCPWILSNCISSIASMLSNPSWEASFSTACRWFVSWSLCFSSGGRHCCILRRSSCVWRYYGIYSALRPACTFNRAPGNQFVFLGRLCGRGSLIIRRDALYPPPSASCCRDRLRFRSSLTSGSYEFALQRRYHGHDACRSQFEFLAHHARNDHHDRLRKCFFCRVLASYHLVARFFGQGEKGLKAGACGVYRILLVALFFCFLGTMLGGIWADMSWGRFWGWDPKENGALMTLLWCSCSLHARLYTSVPVKASSFLPRSEISWQPGGGSVSTSWGLACTLTVLWKAAGSGFSFLWAFRSLRRLQP